MPAERSASQPTGPRRPAARTSTSELAIQLARPLPGQLRWLIGIRLVVITSVVLPFFFYQVTSPDQSPRFDFLYLLSGFTYAASLLYIGLLRWLANQPTLQAYVQFVGDLLLITGLVYNFGGIASPFSVFYFVVVIVAAALLRRRAALAVSGLAWLLYAAIVLALYKGWLSPAGDAQLPAASIAEIGRTLSAHLFGFVTVALLSSHLAQNVVQAETALRRKGEHLADLQVVHRDVIESIPSGLVTTDLEGLVTSVNKAAEEILALTEEQLLGRPVYDFGFFDLDHWRELTVGEASKRARREGEYQRQGESRFIGYALTTLTGAEGAPSGYILIFQDLTEWRKLQEEVRLKDRMAAVGELAAGIAHEIGNPLAAISGSVQMLAASLDGRSSQSQLLEITLKESQRLDRTIKSFLKFARPKDRTSVRFDIAELLAENLKLLQHSSEVAADHRLELELDPPSVPLVADPDQISQIFWNLARNALRAMPDGGTLTVVGQLEEPVYRISFHDTGRGMDLEERAKLFHPFQSFFDGGTGIGMAIVYRIVEEHGGRLTVESQPGVGTSISVELPVHATVPPTQSPA